jgi:hypothetical protein
MMLIRHNRWPHRMIPISYLGADGEERSSWPGHPTLTTAWIAEERQAYAAQGEMDIWEREYMCNAASQADRTFSAEMIRVEPVPRAWQAVYAMIDPARTVRRTSATTGWAVWSWVRNRLIVWEAGAKHLLPDEIVDLVFRINRDYSPVEIGVEEDGLNEWLLQPLRAGMLKHGAVPARGIRAPRGKIDFIRGLQPFFSAGEVVWATDMPDLREQLLAFPTGKIDAPNALAYALLLKPGRLVYSDWNPNRHIDADVRPAWGKPVYLTANATGVCVAGAIAQLVEGRTVVLADWIVEGEPAEVLEGVVREASIASAGAALVLIAGRQHWEQYRNVGLIQAARSLGLDTRPGGDPARGRELIRKELGRVGASGPSFVVAPAARWTLNAFAGGYSLPLRSGTVAAEPEDNRYRLLMEGLEAMAGLLAWGLEDEEEDTAGNFAYDERGRRYRSALPASMQARH